jgi:hypothetical protein
MDLPTQADEVAFHAGFRPNPDITTDRNDRSGDRSMDRHITTPGDGLFPVRVDWHDRVSTKGRSRWRARRSLQALQARLQVRHALL